MNPFTQREVWTVFCARKAILGISDVQSGKGQPSLRRVAARFRFELTMAYFWLTLMLYWPLEVVRNFRICIYLKNFINLKSGHIFMLVWHQSIHFITKFLFFNYRVCEVNNNWENWDWIFMQVQYFSNITYSIDFI